MKKLVILIVVLSGLLAACTAATLATPKTLPDTPAINATTTQSPSLTSTPLPSQTFFPAPSQTFTPTAKPTQTSAPTSIISPEANLVLDRVAQLGGSINGITVVGDVAYVGMGPRVAAIDISDHQHPQLISQSQPLSGLVTQFLTIPTSSSTRMIVNAGKYLVVMDISDPNSPEPISQLELPGAVITMVLDTGRGILYASGSGYEAPYKYSGFIASIDFSNLDSPKVLDTIAFPDAELPISLAYAEGSLFIGTDSYTGGLYRIPLDSPGVLSAPRLVIASSVDSYFAPYSMQVIGNVLYIGAYNTMEAYDITDPDHPSQVWSLSTTALMVKSFSIIGDQIDIFGWAPAGSYLPGQLVLVAPKPITGAPVGEVASFTTTHLDDFLVAYQDLEIYSPNDAQGFKLVGSYQSPVTNVLGAAIGKHAVYVIDGGVGDGRNPVILRVFRLPDLEPLGQVQTELESSCCWFSGIVVAGNRAYIASLNDIWIYDVSSNIPNLIAKHAIKDRQLDAIAVTTLNGQQLLITAQEASMLTILTVYDVADPQNLVPVGNPLTLGQGRVNQVTWDGSMLYIILSAVTEDASDQLYVVSSLNNLLAVQGNLSLPGSVFSLAVHDGRIALSGTEGLMIASAGNPKSPQLLGKVVLPDIGGKVGLLNDGVVVTAGGTGGYASAALLLLFDLQTPTNPLEVQALDIAYENFLLGPMSVSKPYIILTGGSGIEVLEYQIQK